MSCDGRCGETGAAEPRALSAFGRQQMQAVASAAGLKAEPTVVAAALAAAGVGQQALKLIGGGISPTAFLQRVAALTPEQMALEFGPYSAAVQAAIGDAGLAPGRTAGRMQAMVVGPTRPPMDPWGWDGNNGCRDDATVRRTPAGDLPCFDGDCSCDLPAVWYSFTRNRTPSGVYRSQDSDFAGLTSLEQFRHEVRTTSVLSIKTDIASTSITGGGALATNVMTANLLLGFEIRWTVANDDTTDPIIGVAVSDVATLSGPVTSLPRTTFNEILGRSGYIYVPVAHRAAAGQDIGKPLIGTPSGAAGTVSTVTFSGSPATYTYTVTPITTDSAALYRALWALWQWRLYNG
jgi:hypothetical protein